MNCVIVNDACCLIDLKKGRLLHVLLGLPYRFVVPLPIREEELLDFTPQEWRMLDDGGLTTYDLPLEEFLQVSVLNATHGGLSANDCFALVTTKCHSNGILLTGDGPLRKVATSHGVRVHGFSGSSTRSTKPRFARLISWSLRWKSGGQTIRCSCQWMRLISVCAISTKPRRGVSENRRNELKVKECAFLKCQVLSAVLY